MCRQALSLCPSSEVCMCAQTPDTASTAVYSSSSHTPRHAGTDTPVLLMQLVHLVSGLNAESHDPTTGLHLVTSSHSSFSLQTQILPPCPLHSHTIPCQAS
ncbi:hypothetical protein KIL84_000202 [Mauremys mutica]|uniref:Uncharacterized protein n=1 Tax=Mauremys mutica TaxID=74926 RepID=A0A9D3XFU6_9SAUR|nr:hypothetical protein KIL84_000202 [Mauremys mutica]